jgi:hypothetical protein
MLSDRGRTFSAEASVFVRVRPWFKLAAPPPLNAHRLALYLWMLTMIQKLRIA